MYFQNLLNYKIPCLSACLTKSVHAKTFPFIAWTFPSHPGKIPAQIFMLLTWKIKNDKKTWFCFCAYLVNTLTVFFFLSHKKKVMIRIDFFLLKQHKHKTTHTQKTFCRYNRRQKKKENTAKSCVRNRKVAWRGNFSIYIYIVHFLCEPPTNQSCVTRIKIFQRT